MNYNINTTQNVNIEFQLASLGDRILAFLIDSVIKFLYFFILFLLLVWTDVINDPQVWMFVFLLPYLFYSLVCEYFLNGQTFGKIIMKIRVVNKSGDELSFGSCFIRWIFRLVDFQLSSGVAAILAIAIGGKGQRIGDMVAQTTVLKTDGGSKLDETVFVQIPENYKPSFPEVDRLNDADIQTIKEVIVMASKDKAYSNGAPHPILMKTKNIVEKKMQVTSKMSSKLFLDTIIKDYNYFHQ
ncbi:MAG: RDD family protein [Marinilabiliaceae bacterium]|nr:RDD family protein [Marinilabiliaceae bacterium]